MVALVRGKRLNSDRSTHFALSSELVWSQYLLRAMVGTVVLCVFAVVVMNCSGFRWLPSRRLQTPSLLVQRLSLPSGFVSVTTKVDIDQRSNECLDFSYILKELQSLTRTEMGRTLAKESANIVSVIQSSYNHVDTLRSHADTIPFRTALSIKSLLSALENNTGGIDKMDLVQFSDDVQTLIDLRGYLTDPASKLPAFKESADQMQLPEELALCFDSAFDADSNLNEDKYASIRAVRREIAFKKTGIESAMHSMLQSATLKDKLTDPSYVEVEGRYCLQVRDTHKRGLGIVHGTSNSGRTVYVEPSAVVEPTNRLKELRTQLREEENRIYVSMCQIIFAHRDAIRHSVGAAAEVDVLAARARLGILLGGVIPEVGEQGVMMCVEAKHPVLLLRAQRDKQGPRSAGSQVVGNTIQLSQEAPALVISGPNAGGKTVVLKTAGLFALMVRHCIPLPAQPGARVDLFQEVLADIGDLQSVSGDLSTFSGHLLVNKAILDRVLGADAQTHRLVLLDEVGTGTDPAQGSALAQAVLEALVQAGARVVATTHFQRIKNLALTDARFRIAAMEFVRNQPTYVLRVGAVGESFALAAARKLALPEPVLQRAEDLLGDESRSLAQLQQRLQEELDVVRSQQQECADTLSRIALQEEQIRRQGQEAVELVAQLRNGHAEKYLEDLREKERQMDALIAQAEALAEHQQRLLQEKKLAAEGVMASASVPGPTTLQSLREIVRAERVASEHGVVAAVTSARWQAEPLQAGQVVEVGTQLVILDPGSVLQGTTCTVTHRNKGRGRVVVRLAGVETKVERHLLGVPISQIRAALESGQEDALTEKYKRIRRILEEELVDPGRLSFKKPKKVSPPEVVVKVDVTMMGTLAQAQQHLLQVLASPIGSAGIERSALHVLHGVKCVYKEKLRAWLRTQAGVKAVRAVDLSAGGDAVTRVEI